MKIKKLYRLSTHFSVTASEISSKFESCPELELSRDDIPESWTFCWYFWCSSRRIPDRRIILDFVSFRSEVSEEFSEELEIERRIFWEAWNNNFKWNVSKTVFYNFIFCIILLSWSNLKWKCSEMTLLKSFPVCWKCLKTRTPTL